ncbi:hypothetical protein Hypma_005750 [Hypsizygus marmoreus]|uniref:F-box domain-containing protein n=1 Tax=Hypsizygus marmoreus TaxID=39966 RepID=A0A369KB24_HYPMA|nr:hypothetical protein Hypma_005750 [Hypsizygus marmoreus]
MASDLPNELIKEILQYVLYIPDKMFRDPSEVSVFSRLCHTSTSLLLLVCRRWMQVATFLLYETVIIRSKPQANALERTLRENTALGQLIKKLRVEGGYGQAMHRVLISSPNVVELCLSLAIRSSDSTKGLCTALRSINPSHAVIRTARKPSKNGPVKNLLSTLEACFATWKNFRHVYLPANYTHHTDEIVNTLTKAQNLNSVTSSSHALSLSLLESLASNPSLKSINLHCSHSCNLDITSCNGFRNRINEAPNVAALVKIETKDCRPWKTSPGESSIMTATNPSFVPLANASEDTRLGIWDQIIRFATNCGSYQADVFASAGEVKSLNITRTSISRVCRSFRALAHPYIYAHLVFTEFYSLRLLAQSLKETPALGGYVRSLRSVGCMWELYEGDESRKLMHQILLRTPQLSHICAVPSRDPFDLTFSPNLSISWAGFEALATTSGPNVITIGNITIDSSESPCSSLVLGRFSNLRTLACTITVAFDVDSDLVSHDWLAHLEHLELSAPHPSLLQLLSLIDLNSLRVVVLKSCSAHDNVEIFLKRHGCKLTKLKMNVELAALPVLELCSQLPCLELLGARFPNAELFKPRTKHVCLSKVVIMKCKNSTDSFDLKSGEDFVTSRSVNFSSCPAFRELQITFCEWPRHE